MNSAQLLSIKGGKRSGVHTAGARNARGKKTAAVDRESERTGNFVKTGKTSHPNKWIAMGPDGIQRSRGTYGGTPGAGNRKQSRKI